jgi:xanthine dehydrogenase accessory factor
MTETLLELAYRLARDHEPFVLATVVWCERPTSAKPGAQALIRVDGSMVGWIGGSCAQPVVLREAQRMLREGDGPYLMRLGESETAPARSDLRIFPMSCTSGGVLDIYMEPHLPQPQLILIGDSPILAALSQLAAIINFSVIQLASPDMRSMSLDERSFIVVATHGQYDEDVLEQALRSPARYVGLVASRRRAEACRLYLQSVGLSQREIERLKAPAGLDVRAVTPEEIAASILAELVQVRRVSPAVEGELTEENSGQPVSATTRDPVCGMMVEIATARHRSILNGQEYYFCCPACKRLFERNPQEYLIENER